MRGMSTGQKVGWIVVTAFVLLWSLFPVASILMTSFKTQAGLFSGTFLPEEWTLENYEAILAPGGSAQDLFLPSLRNSVGISLIATFIAVVLATFCAYAIARLDFRGKRVILTTALAVSVFPVVSIVTPLFNLWRSIGLYDTWAGLVIPYLSLTLPISIWTLAAFFRQIPWELEQAAQVDGASQFQEPTGSISAAAIVVTVPVVIVVLLFQRRIVSGLTQGAVKG